MKKVAVILGSDSDFPVMQRAVAALKQWEIPVEAHVFSAHRTPGEAAAFAASARENGFGVIIAAAGKAAHLAGVLAAHTTLPIIAQAAGRPYAVVSVFHGCVLDFSVPFLVTFFCTI